MKISEIITDKYKLRMPPTVYYELLADVVEAEDEQEPKTGHWINQDEGAFYPIECSECHKEPLLDSYGDYVFSNYCPVCGARMESVNERC